MASTLLQQWLAATLTSTATVAPPDCSISIKLICEDSSSEARTPASSLSRLPCSWALLLPSPLAYMLCKLPGSTRLACLLTTLEGGVLGGGVTDDALMAKAAAAGVA
jgi:hypothetical protein